MFSERRQLREAFERHEKAFERFGEKHDDLRTFIREMTLRQERVTQAAIAEMEQMRDQIRANTEATWAMLDRFKNGGTAPAG